MSNLLPHTARHADDLCLLRAVQCDSPNHPVAIRQLNTGNLFDFSLTKDAQRRRIDLIQSMNRGQLERLETDRQMEGVIESFELAFRMQTETPPLYDFASESKATLDLYGIGDKTTDQFGRTQQNNGPGQAPGREHNPHGFTMWMAGGGVKGGITYGATDDFAYRAVDGAVHINDLHATMLHLLGMDHERLTFEHHGRPFRLTDVVGQVVNEILA